jgi:hypothetical protein
MELGKVEYAIRKAQDNFDVWNDCTGIIPRFSGYYYEALAVIDDSVRIGIMSALDINIRFDSDGKLIYDRQAQ